MREYKLNRPAPVNGGFTGKNVRKPVKTPALRPKAETSAGIGPAGDLILEFLQMIRSQFYFDKPDFHFHQHRSILIKAFTYPASYLAARGMTQELPAARYRHLVQDVIQEVKRFGQMSSAISPAHYFFKVMQTHMQHHGEDYYDECRSVRNAVAQITAGVSKVPETDSTLADLAALHRLAASGARRVKQKPASPQLDLFA
jgi:hypothetical protein